MKIRRKSTVPVKYEPQTQASQHQKAVREELYRLYNDSPLPVDELMINLGLYIRSSALAKFLFLDELYRKVVDVPGHIMVFGTWWGQDVVVLHNLRAIHEPYNSVRKVIGFDTFTGYPPPAAQDKPSETIKRGAYGVTAGYQSYLDELLEYHTLENTTPHIRKHELVAGDATKTLEAYLDRQKETVVALAYLDMALYEPTKRVLELLKPRMPKGAVIALDELNASAYPGETQAFSEVFGIQGRALFRSKFLPDRSYTVL